jgi:hypothetical protein
MTNKKTEGVYVNCWSDIILWVYVAAAFSPGVGYEELQTEWVCIRYTEIFFGYFKFELEVTRIIENSECKKIIFVLLSISWGLI